MFGDWIYVSLLNLNIGKVYSVDNNIVLSALDPDSYIVVYELDEEFIATYSFVDSDLNLYFKSVSDISYGSRPVGTYYVYYHSDNVQYIETFGSSYVQISPNSSSGFMGSESVAGLGFVDRYSNVVLGGPTNTRVASLSFISTSGSWEGLSSNVPGNKAMGRFDGPLVKIYGSKKPTGGKASVKIIKTSSSGNGQSVIREDVIDLFSLNTEIDTLIYELDVKDYISFEDLNEYYDSQNYQEEQRAAIRGSFVFEIEILNESNISSSGKDVEVTKYAFGKNHSLTVGEEEIYDQIVFISTGVIR